MFILEFLKNPRAIVTFVFALFALAVLRFGDQIGLGGRDVNFTDFDQIFDRCKAVLGGAPIPPFELIQVRGGHYGKA